MGTKQVLFVNGSLRGEHGNTAHLMRAASHRLAPSLQPIDLVLASYSGSTEAMVDTVRRADAFVFGTGVYWGNWGSPLQRFLEVMTAHEVSDLFMGKPAVALATMDSVGGSDLGQRLLGVLSNFGCLIPPLASVVVSRVGNACPASELDADVWRLDDLDPVMHNLVLAIGASQLPWRTWPVVATEPVQGPYPASGLMMSGLPQFLVGPDVALVDRPEPSPGHPPVD